MRFHPNLLPDEPVGDRFLVVDAQHDSVIQSSVWHVLPTSSPYPDVTKELVFKGLTCLVAGHSDRIQRTR